MKTKVKKRVSIILTIALCATLGSRYVRADETSASEAQGINVAYHTQDEIRAFCNASGVTEDDSLTYAQKPVVSGAYSAGKLSDETLDSAVKMTNCMRYIAGISADVQLNDDYGKMAQAASLLNYVNNELSHYPEKPADMDESLYTLGAEGSGSSNIAWVSWENGSLNWNIVNGWMEDGDTNNISRVGHRRWILNPEMGYTGFGAVSGKNGTYSAMYVFDSQNSSADEYGVAWPAQNMPLEYFKTGYPWSISMGENVDIDSVKVKLTRKSDGRTWNFSNKEADGYFNVDNSGRGQSGCIIFRPELDRGYTAGDVFDVQITGLGSRNDVSYSVNFFNLEETKEPTTKPTEEPTIKPTDAPTEEPTIKPTETPSEEPTEEPTIKPTETPSEEPTEEPTIKPTETPTEEPTEEPMIKPTETPTEKPTVTPSDNKGTSQNKKPSKVNIKKWIIKKNKVTICFNKIKNVSGYQVQYSTNAKFKKNVKNKYISKKLTKTIISLKKVKSANRYYIRIRAYKNTYTQKKSKKVYGRWSDVIAVNID